MVALTVVENKRPDVSCLVKKQNMTQKFVNLKKNLLILIMANTLLLQSLILWLLMFFNARLAQANLIAKTDFDAKLSSLNRKITSNKSKHLLVENELKKLKIFGLSYFIGKSHFEEDGTQNYLVFQPMYRYFKRIAGVGNGNYIYYWQSKGLSDERINSIKTPNYIITPKLNYYGTKTRVEFNGSCLKQDKITYTH